MLGEPLVNTPEAIEFFQLPNVMRKLLLGDPQKLDDSVYNPVVAAHNALGDGMVKIAALKNDKTRTEVQRHAAASTVAEKTVVVLADAQSKLQANSKRLLNEAHATVEEVFAVDPNRASLQSEIRGWIREQAAKPEGLRTIREAMNVDREVAAVIYHSQHFLLGLATSVRESMRIDAIEKHLPKAFAKIESSIALNDAATKYTGAIARVRRTFSNKALAAQAASRVEV